MAQHHARSNEVTKIFDKSPGIGLDIGSQRIKVAQVRNSPKGLKVMGFDSMETPPGTVEAGNIVDPVGLGAELKKMVTQLKLKHRRVVSAVAGQQVYTRNIVMPHMRMEELKQAISFQAINFLPIPVEEAAIDIFPLRDFENEEGKHTEVFFVAVRRRQVENLDMACNIAGLNLAAVEIEPLAMNRVLGRNNPEEVGAYLNIGSSSSFFSVFKDNMLMFYRSMSCGCSAFYAAMEMKAAANSGKTEEIQFDQSSQYDYLTRDIIDEVTRSVEYYNLQKGSFDQGIEKVWLCGGGARFKGLDANLAAGSSLEIVAADPLSSLIIPERLSPEQKENLQYEYLIALGLAARM